MRIAFLCGGLEPGRDGVGDYTRLLAGECVRQGHECILIALNDRYLDGIVTSTPPAGSGEVPAVRLPASVPWPELGERAGRQLEAFHPDWVSLQFVCYAFHPRGLIHGLASKLQPLVAGRRLHLMFHELWIGADAKASWKERMMGALQKDLILRLTRRLQPAVVSTSNTAYQAMLGRHGITAPLLPLFGNIPIVAEPNEDWLFSACADARLELRRSNRGDFMILGIFGALHPNWPPEPLFSSLRAAAAAENKRVIVASIGRLGSGDRLWSDLTRRYDRQIGFIGLDEQPATRISDFLHWIDYGIATSPWQLIGKSGSVASMLEHGLPVIVNRDDVQFGGEVAAPALHDPLLMKMDAPFAAGMPNSRKRPPRAGVPAVAREFLKLLREAEI